MRLFALIVQLNVSFLLETTIHTVTRFILIRPTYLVSVKRITSDVAVCNEDRNELEIASELSLALGGFVIPRRGGARQSRVQDY